MPPGLVLCWRSLNTIITLTHCLINLPFVHGFDFVYYKNHPSSPGEIDDEVKGGIDDQEEMVEASDA